MRTKAECIICLGTNHNQAENISKAISTLTTLFPDITFGKPVITPAEGSVTAPDYTNLAARFTTTALPEDLKIHFKEIEHLCGRTPQSKSTGIIPLDIDLLIYDNNILKPQDMETEYVRQSLSTLH